MKHYNVKITGNVQDVGLRASCMRKAQELGVFGFARNELDGSVYLEVEGEDVKVEEFLEALRSGFGNIQVNFSEVIESPPKGYTVFDIKFGKTG